MSPSEHIVLYLILFSFYYLWGKCFSNQKDAIIYWVSAIIPILLYSFIVGSRYGWGNDYMSYKYKMEHAFTFPDEQIGFRWLNQAIDLMGLNFVGGYIIYSFIFILCAFILIRSYKKESKHMYVFLIPATFIFINYAIRQGIAFSFMMLALYFFNSKKWVLMIIAIIIGSIIHTSILVTIVMVGGIYILFKKPISWKITIPLYLFFTFIYDVSNTAFISKMLGDISLGNKFQNYIDSSDRWFGEQAIEDAFIQSMPAKILSSLFNIAIIYLGYYALKFKENSKILYLYNVSTIGMIFLRAVYQFEILRRFALPMVILYFIPLGYAIYVFGYIKRFHINFQIFKFSKIPLSLYYTYVFIIVFYLILFLGRFIFLNQEAMFFWNV